MRQRVEGVGVVTEDIEQIRRMIGSEDLFLTENVLEQTNSLFQILVFYSDMASRFTT